MTSTTRLVISLVILSDLLVQSGVKDSRFRSQVRFQDRNTILLVEFLNRIVRHQIQQIAEDARLRRTDFHARRFESARDAVVTKRAFLGRLGNWVQEAAAVR